MNKEQEDLIATGIWLLIKNNDKIRTSEKQVWMMDYDKLFVEDDAEQPLCEHDWEEHGCASPIREFYICTKCRKEKRVLEHPLSELNSHQANNISNVTSVFTPDDTRKGCGKIIDDNIVRKIYCGEKDILCDKCQLDLEPEPESAEKKIQNAQSSQNSSEKSKSELTLDDEIKREIDKDYEEIEHDDRSPTKRWRI